MHVSRARNRFRLERRLPKRDDMPIVITANQTPEDIERRREIREAAHDARAKIIRGKRA
jgi:hypothetical protein